MRNGNSTYSLHHIGNRVTGAPAAQPAFDDDGNLTSDGNGKWFSWNAENRMIEVRDYDQTPHDGAVRTRFVYDSQGRRVQKLNESYDLATDNWTATSDHRYFYDGWNLLFEIDTLSTDPTRYFVWGLDLSQSMQGAGGVGGLLFTKTASATHAVSYDASGNISEYIDLADGSIDAHLEYDAFGRTIVSTGSAPANFGFSTKYLDEETGYYYYGFRYYDTETGRWLNRDPIREAGGYNLYGFVLNSPLMLIDAKGEVHVLVYIGAAALAVYIYNTYIDAPPDPDDVYQTMDVVGVRGAEAKTISLGYSDDVITEPNVGSYFQYDEVSEDCYIMYEYDVDLEVTDENFARGTEYTFQNARVEGTEDKLGYAISTASRISSFIDLIPGDSDKYTDISDAIIFGADVAHEFSKPEMGFTWTWYGETFKSFTQESTYSSYHVTEIIKWDSKRAVEGGIYRDHYKATLEMQRLNSLERPGIDEAKNKYKSNVF